MGIDAKQANEFAQKLDSFMEERGLTNTYIARALDLSTSVISQFRRSLYKGDLELIVNKVLNYINSVCRKEDSGIKETFVETSIATKIKMLITVVEEYSGGNEAKIGLVVGDAGHGKSDCLREYAKANRNSLYVELDRTMNATRIFAAIAKSLKLDSSGSLAAIAERVVEALEGRQLIIILDESSSLNVSVLDQLRQIIVVKGKCPLILAGNNDLLATINQSNTRRGYESLDQFKSRVMMVLDLDRLAADPDGGLYTPADIRKLYQFGGIKLSTDAVRRLRQISKAPRMGRLRACTQIIQALHKFCSHTGADLITADLIDRAIPELGLLIKDKLPLIPDSVEPEAEQQAVAKAG